MKTAKQIAARSDIEIADIFKIQLLRKDICEQIHSPYLEDIVQDAFVRVLEGANRYRLCRVVQLQKCDKPYTVQSGADQAKHQNVETRIELVLAFGRLQKRFKLSLVSNTPATTSELEALIQAQSAAG